jgi:aspartate aminotransferase
MIARPVAGQIELLRQAMRPFLEAIAHAAQARRPSDAPVADFLAGNPQEPALPGYVDALTRWSVPQDNEWFGYKMMNPKAQDAAAAALSVRLGLSIQADDIFLARGALGGLATALRAVIDPGDEVIFLSPPWFFYEAMIIAAGATPIRVRVNQTSFDLDVDAISKAVSARTRALIVNTPHNPTGKIYPPETLQRLAACLTAAAQHNGRPIYLVSDEAYNRVVFDGRPFHSPGRFYSYSLLVQTYSKSTLAPSQRLGYVALPSSMPDREQVRAALMMVSFAHGYALPDAVMQYALPDIEPLSIDIDHLQRKRDRMVKALREQGYHLHVPEATFYLLPRSPLADDAAFVELLARRNVFVLAGRAVEMPGFFRISLTANDQMIDRALPEFAAAMEEARSLAAAPRR